MGFLGLIFLEKYGLVKKKKMVVYFCVGLEEIVLGKNGCDGWKKGCGFFELMMRDSNGVLGFFFPSGGGEFQIV